MSRNFRVRLRRDLDEQLMGICEATQLRTSTAIRLAVEYVLGHPEAWDIFHRGAPYSLVDTRTAAQVFAWEEHQRTLEAFDMQAVARAQGVV